MSFRYFSCIACMTAFILPSRVSTSLTHSSCFLHAFIFLNFYYGFLFYLILIYDYCLAICCRFIYDSICSLCICSVFFHTFIGVSSVRTKGALTKRTQQETTWHNDVCLYCISCAIGYVRCVSGWVFLVVVVLSFVYCLSCWVDCFFLCIFFSFSLFTAVS